MRGVHGSAWEWDSLDDTGALEYHGQKSQAACGLVMEKEFGGVGTFGYGIFGMAEP